MANQLEYTRLVCSKLSQAKALCEKSAPPLSSKELLDSLQDLLQGGRGPFETEVRKQAAASTIREASDPSPGAKPPSGATKSACAGAATAMKEEAQCSPVLKVKEVEVKASMPAVVIKGAASRPAAVAQRAEPAPGPTATVTVKHEPAPAAPALASPAQAAAAADQRRVAAFCQRADRLAALLRPHARANANLQAQVRKVGQYAACARGALAAFAAAAAAAGAGSHPGAGAGGVAPRRLAAAAPPPPPAAACAQLAAAAERIAKTDELVRKALERAAAGAAVPPGPPLPPAAVVSEPPPAARRVSRPPLRAATGATLPRSQSSAALEPAFHPNQAALDALAGRAPVSTVPFKSTPPQHPAVLSMAPEAPLKSTKTPTRGKGLPSKASKGRAEKAKGAARDQGETISMEFALEWANYSDDDDSPAASPTQPARAAATARGPPPARPLPRVGGGRSPLSALPGPAPKSPGAGGGAVRARGGGGGGGAVRGRFATNANGASFRMDVRAAASPGYGPAPAHPRARGPWPSKLQVTITANGPAPPSAGGLVSPVGIASFPSSPLFMEEDGLDEDAFWAMGGGAAKKEGEGAAAAAAAAAAAGGGAEPGPTVVPEDLDFFSDDEEVFDLAASLEASPLLGPSPVPAGAGAAAAADPEPLELGAKPPSGAAASAAAAGGAAPAATVVPGSPGVRGPGKRDGGAPPTGQKAAKKPFSQAAAAAAATAAAGAEDKGPAAGLGDLEEDWPSFTAADPDDLSELFDDFFDLESGGAAALAPAAAAPKPRPPAAAAAANHPPIWTTHHFADKLRAINAKDRRAIETV